MNLNSKRSSLADVRLEIVTGLQADLKVQFLELMDLRERLQEAEFQRICRRERGLESPRQLLSPQSASVRRTVLGTKGDLSSRLRASGQKPHKLPRRKPKGWRPRYQWSPGPGPLVDFDSLLARAHDDQWQTPVS
jgi:hypothetical protein